MYVIDWKLLLTIFAGFREESIYLKFAVLDMFLFVLGVAWLHVLCFPKVEDHKRFSQKME